jgi:hypothetical protein
VSISSGREEGVVQWKFAISAIVMFVMSLGLGMLIHGVLLHDDYARYPNLMRPLSEVQAKFPVSALAHVCLALAFSWIYLKGREEKAWVWQGVRYGFAIALLSAIPAYLIYYAVVPIPFTLTLKAMVYDSVRLALMGVVLAWINR